MRGEYIRLPGGFDPEPGSPPLARGILYYFIKNIKRTGITPACAGNTGRPDCRIRPKRDHPRLRGEYLSGICESFDGQGSPPLARGILNFHNPYVSSPRITPACAGNTMEEFYKQNMTEDHPRLRGEYKPKFKIFKCSRGSPPLARGILWN